MRRAASLFGITDSVRHRAPALAAQWVMAVMRAVATPRPRAAGSTHIEMSSASAPAPSALWGRGVPVAIPTRSLVSESTARRSIAPGIDRRSRQRPSAASAQSPNREPKAPGASVSAASLIDRHTCQSSADTVSTSIVMPQRYRAGGGALRIVGDTCSCDQQPR
jgi:hypothetical protein